MDDFLWEKEVRDFVEALRSAGLETFVYTNQSTAVMENLHAFAAEGCTMMGLCTITRQETRWGEEEPYEVQGIRHGAYGLCWSFIMCTVPVRIICAHYGVELT